MSSDPSQRSSRPTQETHQEINSNTSLELKSDINQKSNGPELNQVTQTTLPGEILLHQDPNDAIKHQEHEQLAQDQQHSIHGIRTKGAPMSIQLQEPLRV